MLYSLQIIQQEFMNVQLPQRDEDLYDEDVQADFSKNMLANNKPILEAYEQ